jgi:hypothetical protein
VPSFHQTPDPTPVAVSSVCFGEPAQNKKAGPPSHVLRQLGHLWGRPDAFRTLFTKGWALSKHSIINLTLKKGLVNCKKGLQVSRRWRIFLWHGSLFLLKWQLMEGNKQFKP